MCGIAGLIHVDQAIAANALTKMIAKLRHRGPDDTGSAVLPSGEGHVALGHTRLSILDLTSLGRQPMLHPPTGCQLVFNGEIYNYRRLRSELERGGEKFHSGSDTEVLLVGLARQGEAFLEQLHGMYAFAFFDPRERFLYLARDPAGIKPLYLAETGDGLIFASETRAILATGLIRPRIDAGAVAGYLAYGAVQHPLSLFEGVTSLPPGSALKLRVGVQGHWIKTSLPRVFWRMPPPNEDISKVGAIAAVREILNAAVSDHLIADVPVGVFLSSGLDSTIIAGLAARHAALNSFTVTFEDQPEFSENRLAAESAALFGLTHSEIQVPMVAAEAAVSDWLAALDQPSIDGLNVFLISRAVRSHGMKVALSGLGADELFGGYPSFRDVPRLRRMMRMVGPLPGEVRRGLARLATVGRSRAVRTKLMDMAGGDGSARSLYLHRRRAMSDAQLSRLGLKAWDLGLDQDFLPADAAPDVDPGEGDLVRTVSQLEFRLYQGNMLLRDADVNGMAFGLEIRVPMLDRRLLDLVHALPGNVRLPRGATGKHLLRQAFPEFLRPAIFNQPKRGFTLPIRRWMAGSLRPTCEKALTTLQDSRILNPDGVAAVWREFRAEPESPMWTRAFALVVLGDFVARHAAA